MMTTVKTIRRFWGDQCGQNLTEYALMLAFVVTALGAACPSLALSIENVLTKTGAVVSAAATNGGPGPVGGASGN